MTRKVVPKTEPMESKPQVEIEFNELMTKHFNEAYKQTNNKKNLQTMINKYLDKDDFFFVGWMARKGFPQLLEDEKKIRENYGVVATLLCGIAGGIATAPLTPTTAEDFYSDSRATLIFVYFWFLYASIILSALTVAFCLIEVNAFHAFVMDFDDYLQFQETFGWFFDPFILWPLIFSLVFFCLSISFASLITMPNPQGTVGMVIILIVLGLGIAAGTALNLVTMGRHFKGTTTWNLKAIHREVSETLFPNPITETKQDEQGSSHQVKQSKQDSHPDDMEEHQPAQNDSNHDQMELAGSGKAKH